MDAWVCGAGAERVVLPRYFLCMDGWMFATSSIHDFNLSTNQNQAYFCVFSSPIRINQYSWCNF